MYKFIEAVSIDIIYISLKHEDSQYGREVEQVLAKGLKEKGLCIAKSYSFSIKLTSNDNDVFELIKHDIYSDMFILIVNSEDTGFTFFRKAKATGMKDKVWFHYYQTDSMDLTEHYVRDEYKKLLPDINYN